MSCMYYVSVSKAEAVSEFLKRPEIRNHQTSNLCHGGELLPRVKGGSPEKDNQLKKNVIHL